MRQGYRQINRETPSVSEVEVGICVQVSREQSEDRHQPIIKSDW